jgi:hypothetical protein
MFKSYNKEKLYVHPDSEGLIGYYDDSGNFIWLFKTNYWQERHIRISNAHRIVECWNAYRDAMEIIVTQGPHEFNRMIKARKNETYQKEQQKQFKDVKLTKQELEKYKELKKKIEAPEEIKEKQKFKFV